MARVRRKRPWSERPRAHDWEKVDDGQVHALNPGRGRPLWKCKKCGIQERSNQVPNHYMSVVCRDGQSRLCDDFTVWKIQET